MLDISDLVSDKRAAYSERGAMKKLLLVSFLSIAFAVREAQAEVPVIGGPVTNTATGRIYYLLSESTWRDAEAQAVKLGGHLATIRSKAEQDWIINTFYGWGGSTNRSLWIGLNDSQTEGRFVWTSGEPVTYTNWRTGEPDNADGKENYAEMVIDGERRGQPDFGQWNDLVGRESGRAGLVEITPRYVWIKWPASEGGNDHFYTLTAVPYENWFHAEAEAVLLGGHLVSINSAEEQAFLEATFLAGHSRSNIYWIGLNDVVSEGTFIWSSGEAVTYTNWAPWEPNDNIPGEDAVVMNWHYGLGEGRYGQWNDWIAADPPRHVRYWYRGVVEAPEPRTTLMKISGADVVEGETNVCRTGTSWIDYDGDSYTDLFISVYGGPNLLYRNRGDGAFEKVKTGNLVTDPACCLGATWGDYNNDGNLDVFVPDLACGRLNSLYQGTASGSFIKVAVWPFTQDEARSATAAWADYDRDGFLDLFVVANAPNQFNLLYHNRGDGTFGKVLQGSIANEVTFSACATWADYDNDGDPDLFVTSESVGPNRLYRNDGKGSFVKITQGPLVTEGGASRGCAWGDYDNDGDLDLFVANVGKNYLYRNLGNGTFEKISTGPIVRDTAFCVACCWGDYDNDGFLDLFVANFNREGNFLYHNNGDGTFTKVTEGSVVEDKGRSRGCAWGDYDNDGFLDLFVTNDTGEPNFLYRAIPNLNHWLKVRLIGTLSNRAAIGAKVRALATIAGKRMWQLREISGGTGYGSQNALEAHFGLRDATAVEVLRIEWPSGIVQEYHGVSADQIITVTEPPVLNALGITSPAQFELILSSGGGFTYQIERTVDLHTWTPVVLANNVNGLVQVVDGVPDSPAHAFYRAVEVPLSGPGLAAWWPANGTPQDRLGAYNARLHGGVAFVPGVFGKAFNINVNGGWIDTMAPPITNVDNWTFEAWVFWRGLDPLGKHRNHFLFHIGHTGKNGYGLEIPDVVKCREQTSLRGREGMAHVIYGGINEFPTGYYPRPNIWTHLVLVRSGGVLHLYANGSEVFSLKTDDPRPPGEPLLIGYQGAEETFDGIVDEPRVWSRALTDLEVRQIYRVGALQLALPR